MLLPDSEGDEMRSREERHCSERKTGDAMAFASTRRSRPRHLEERICIRRST